MQNIWEKVFLYFNVKEKQIFFILNEVY